MGQTTFTGPVISQNGFIDASFTTAERDAIPDPQPGLLIYNTDVNSYQVCTTSGATPVWDAAFGGGGGGGGSWPYYLGGLQSTISFAPGGSPYYGPIVFNTNGTQYVAYGDEGAAPFKLTYTNLATPYDIAGSVTSSGYMSGAGTYDINGSEVRGGFYNANGTAFYVVQDNGGGSARAATFTLTTPYDAQSATYDSYVDYGYAGPFASMNGFSMSADGTKATYLIVDNGVVKATVMTLTTPFDLSTSQYGPEVDIDSYFNNVVTAQTSRTMHGIAMNSTGTVLFASGYFGGITGNNTYIVELRLGTAYDFTSISDSYSQSSGSTTTVQSEGALTLAGSKLYLVGQTTGFFWVLGQYNVTPMTQPNITGVSPSTGTTGTSVTITGTGFTGVSSVTFGGFAATINSISDTEIVVTAPNTGTNSAVDVAVDNPVGISTEVAAFTNTSPPVSLWGTSSFTDNNYTVDNFSLGSPGTTGPTTLSVNLASYPGNEAALLALPVGTVFTVVSGSMIGVGDTFTLTNQFSGGGGSFSADANYVGSGYMLGMSSVGQFSVI